MEKIGILGGSFNPIHLGHINAAREVKELLNLDQIIFIPAKIQPLKGELKNVSHSKRRELLALALKDQPDFEISDLELSRPGPSYTLDTLLELNKVYLAKQLYFIVGVDSLLELDKWKEPRTLLSLANFVVIERPSAPELSFSLFNLIAEKWGYCYNDTRPILESGVDVNSKSADISSSNVRTSKVNLATNTTAINTLDKRRNYDNKNDNSTSLQDSGFQDSGQPCHKKPYTDQSLLLDSAHPKDLNTTNSSLLRHRTPYMLAKLSNSFELQLIGVSLTPHQISSSEIRRRIMLDESISGLVPKVVEQRIKEAYTKT